MNSAVLSERKDYAVRMPAHKNFYLNPNDKKLLQEIAKKRNIPQWKYKRAKILLLLEQDNTYKEIEFKLDTNSSTIGLWKRRYLKFGIDGLKDAPRPGKKKTVTKEIEAKVLKVVQEKLPKGKTHWSGPAISKVTGIPPRTVADILKRNNLKPHLHRTFMVSNDPDFEKKAAEIIGLYMNPPANAVVICVDEKTAIQALDRLQPNLPLKPHQIERSTFEYKRNGVTSLYAAFNTKTGEVTGNCSKKHTQFDFINFLNILDKKYSGKEIHVILDNFRAHKTEKVEEWLQSHPKWKFHFTPTYSSWINQVECWFSIISRQCIRRGIFESVKDLITKIKTFIVAYNKNAKPFKWTYSNPEQRIAV